jgi:hypothetical protein
LPQTAKALPTYWENQGTVEKVKPKRNKKKRKERKYKLSNEVGSKIP